MLHAVFHSARPANSTYGHGLSEVGQHQLTWYLRLTEKTKRTQGKLIWLTGPKRVGEGFVGGLGNTSGFTNKSFKNKIHLKCCDMGLGHRLRNRDTAKQREDLIDPGPGSSWLWPNPRSPCKEGACTFPALGTHSYQGADDRLIE